MKNEKMKYFFYGLSFMAFQPFAFGSGLEKNVMWSGRNAGVAGAVTSSVAGPESLFFNPAGLGGTMGLGTTVNFSPTLSKFSGPNPVTGAELSSNTSFSPPASLFVSYGVTPKLGVGIGFYTSGGTKAVYEGVSLGAAGGAGTHTLQSDLGINELSAGAGYEILDGLRVGLGYRVVMVKASLSMFKPGTPASTVAAFNDISTTRYNGFRVGLQYAPRDSRWGLGAQWRTQVDFSGEGTTSATVVGATTPAATGTATLAASFPQHVSFGGFFDIIPGEWRALAQYDFTEYSKDQALSLSGTLGGAALTNVALNWQNMSNFRLGTEYKLRENWLLRGGYVFTTQVTPNSNPLLTFAAPGSAHSFYLGTGATIMPNLSLDGALELSTISGTVAAGEGVGPVGDYSTKAYAAHIGLTYNWGTI